MRLKEFLLFKCPPTSRHTLTSPRNPTCPKSKLQSRRRSTTCRGQKRISSDRSPTSLSLGREIKRRDAVTVWPEKTHLTHGNTWEQHWKNAATYQMNVENAWSWLRSTTQPKKTNSTWQKTAIGPNDLFFVDDLCPVISVTIYHSISKLFLVKPIRVVSSLIFLLASHVYFLWAVWSYPQRQYLGVCKWYIHVYPLNGKLINI